MPRRELKGPTLRPGSGARLSRRRGGSTISTTKQKSFTFTLNTRENKILNTSITSDWRLLLRGFYAFLIAIAVFWAMARNAQGQHLYVTDQRGVRLGFVSEFNASTG